MCLHQCTLVTSMVRLHIADGRPNPHDPSTRNSVIHLPSKKDAKQERTMIGVSSEYAWWSLVASLRGSTESSPLLELQQQVSIPLESRASLIRKQTRVIQPKKLYFVEFCTHGMHKATVWGCLRSVQKTRDES